MGLHHRAWAAEPGHAGTADDPWVRHRSGTPWNQAALPRRWHGCRPQTVELWDERRLDQPGTVRTGRIVCACGAVATESGWIAKNGRRDELWTPVTPHLSVRLARADPPRVRDSRRATSAAS